MKIGIIGGTYNPIHIAHLRIAEEVRDRLALDKIIFVPAAQPPHKPLAGELPFAQRRTMVQLAVENNPAFCISDMEGKRGGKSYSIDTLRAFRSECPDDDFYFIIGSDSFIDIGSWHKYRDIFCCCNIVVVERPGYPVPDMLAALPIAITGEFCYHASDKLLQHSSGHSVHYLAGCPLDISSSAIRSLAQEGRSIRYLVPTAVEHYIKEQRLYANAHSNKK